MGFRYYTQVIFPVGAMQLAPVREAVEKNYKPNGIYLALEDDGSESGLVQVSDSEANWGDMSEITSILDEFEVPYNVVHSESEGSMSVPWTEYVRFDGTSQSLDEVQENSALFAKELLALLDKGDLQLLRAKLEADAKNVPPPMPEDWQPTPETLAMAQDYYDGEES